MSDNVQLNTHIPRELKAELAKLPPRTMAKFITAVLTAALTQQARQAAIERIRAALILIENEDVQND